MSTEPAADLLSHRGRRARIVATVVGVALLLAGTLVGTDDDFPFGPFRMFATTNSWDEPIRTARAEIITTDGGTIELTEHNSGVRRAELEGQLDRFRAEPSRLAPLAAAYRARNPDADRPASVTVLVRNHEIGRTGPTGHYTDEVVATWKL